MNLQKMRRVQFGELIEFVVVAEHRSFTRAAVQLGVSTPALSQTIRGVEERLGLRLLNRTTRQVAPTVAGERLLQRLRPVMEDLDSALEELNQYRITPAGCLRLAVARAAGHVLAPVLARFVSRYPDIRIDISAGEGPFDLAAGYDAAIQLGGDVADTMVAVRISPDIRNTIVGAPSYFARYPAPQTPRELPEHNCIRLKTDSGKLDAWLFAQGDAEFSVPVDGAIVLDDMELALRTALGGGGLLYLPRSRAHAALAAGTLQEVLEEWLPRPTGGFVLCYPSRTKNSAALQCLSEFLRETLHRGAPGVAPPDPQPDARGAELRM